MSGDTSGDTPQTTLGDTSTDTPPVRTPLAGGTHSGDTLGHTSRLEGATGGCPVRDTPVPQAHRLIVGDVIRGALDDNTINLTPTAERAVIARALELLDIAGYTLTRPTQETDRASS